MYTQTVGLYLHNFLIFIIINFNRLKMNTLNIDKEVKKVDFTYMTTTLKFNGTCTVSANKEVSDIIAQINLKENDINIGNCNSNDSISINIWNNEYKSYIDSVATEFKKLQEDLVSHYNNSSSNDETL